MLKLKLIKCWKMMMLTLVSMLFSLSLFAQTHTIRGKVIDEKGEALPGATVKVAGTNSGATTTNTGEFSLQVPAGSTRITISFVGYLAVEKTITAQTTSLGTVAMERNTRDLNEVQVVGVGYGSVRKTDVTGTVVTVDAKALQEIPSANVFEQLKGRVAGLDVVSGSSGPAITIRGNRTIGNPGADRPLVVLDGQPYYNFIENINPNDIKTVEVLKGASATAIYGSRGSGGVLLITTNRGRVGQTVTSFDSYTGISVLEGNLAVLNGEQYAQLKKDAVRGSILQSNGPSESNPLTPKEREALANGVSTNWVDLYTKPALQTDHSLRVSSGTEITQFNAGLAYRRNNGLEPNINNDRYTLSTNVDHKISKVVKIGASILLSLRNSNTGGSGQIGNAQWITPLASPYNPDGSVNYFPMEGSQDATTLSPLVPGVIPDSYYNNTRGFLNNDIVYAEISPVKHLKYKFTVNYNFSQSLQGIYNGINRGGIQTIDKTSASTTNNYSYRLAQEHLVTYDNIIKEKHSVNFVAGFLTEKQRTENSTSSVTNVPSDAVRNLNLGLGTFNSQSGSLTETGLISYVSRLNYAYDGKYDLTATFRIDGNSALAEGKKYTSYPAVGLGWVMSNEKFIQKLTFIDNLKLRAGYGENSTTGSISPYGTLGRLSSQNYQYGGVSAGNSTGVRVTTLVNNQLTWQRTRDYNLALDFGLFKNRLTGSIEVYKQRTTDIILNNVLPPTTGANGQATNLGTSANKGLEISLSSQNIRDLGGFSWSTDFNIAFSREKIVELPNGSPFDINTGLFVGQPLSVIYDLRRLGIWQIGDSPGINTAKSTTDGGTVYLPVSGQTSPLQYPGQIRVEDVNKDGKIDANDNQILGNFQPDYTFGFTNRFAYKRFDLNIVIQGRMGFTTIVPYVSSSNSGTNGWQFLNIGRHNQPVIDYWTPENPGGYFPMPNSQVQSANYSTLQYFDGSFIRAKSINVGYNFSEKLAKHIGMSSLRVYANVTNPFIIYAPVMNHSFTVTDPESINNINPTAVSASGNIGGFNQNNNNGFRGVGISPGLQTRDFIIGINARF
ncbi:SusC/RagA family TonB-linked outer membrane protein [Pedobacter duraquae]|uniref:TonB-linked SusC/RagA family outer membrane protein n=1 Tax=Pedobacter duraquae TaxID=425511 RepID=A0A4V3C3M9_9SPHI|nr:SusC/RagA family TonB-linked outer membrane protein [Pedobacter duraquae]TDO22708.1 TonB-linked SusC/RagA family outer membrane protein [Pedobacter duraquae]